MEQNNNNDPYQSARGNSYASSRYTTGRTNSTSSTQPLMGQSSQGYGEEHRLQHSATFYPSAHDDYFTPYNIDWGTGDGLVTTPPPISPPEQRPSQTRTQSFYSDVSTPQSYPMSPPDLTPGPYTGAAGAGVVGRSGEGPSPPGGHTIYTPSTGSSPSASSPPQQAASMIQPPPSAISASTSYVAKDHIRSPAVSTMRNSTSSVSESDPSAGSKPLARSATMSKLLSGRFSRGSILPIQEHEVLQTKEAETHHLDPMEYSEETGGWVRKARNKGGNLVRSVTQKFSTYRPVSGEDRDLKKLTRASALKNDEDNAWKEGYVGVDYEMFGAFDSEVPERTMDAMKHNNGNVDYAYTGTGEVVDLSSLQGLGADEDEIDDDGKSRRNSFALTTRATGFGPNEKSYYFPEDPDTPNWKPRTMRPLYLTILQFLALCIIGFCEFLYQYSVKRGRETEWPPHITNFRDIEKIPMLHFALWKYFPTVIAVTFGVLVQLTDAEVKRVEPYFQLSRKPKGARAANSLNIEYLTFWAILCPIQAIRHKHWAVLLSSVAAILAFAAVPPLQSVFLDLDPDLDVREKNPDEMKFIVVHPIWTRLLEAVMFVIFLLIGALQFTLYRRKTGLVGDPSGIAGVAAMANKAHILMDFKGLDLAGTSKIHKQLNKRTYILHKACLWQAEFLKENERPIESSKDQNAHPLFLRLEGGIPLIIYLLGVLIMILVLFKPKSNVTIIKSTWFLTALSISIKMFWEVIDRDLRILQPFYLLYKRHAHPDVLTLDYTATIPGWIIFKTIRNKHYLLTYITTITLLNEVLTVCMGSLDQVSGEETTNSHIISLTLSTVIMGGQIIGVIVALYLRRHPFLPRQPGTISSVLAYIYASQMLPDFDNMETKETEERRKMLAAKGKTYGFGWFKGLVDGRWHLGIDQEELLRSYKHGDRFLESVVQGVPSGLDQY